MTSEAAMQQVLVLQHVACEGPGDIGAALQRRGMTIRVVRIDQGESVPAGLDADALVVMGGPMGVYEADRHPHLRAELRLIEDALHRSRPVLGVCLGSQLLAAALGVRVYPSGGKELGWYRVDLAAAAEDDALFRTAPRRFIALHWHGDIFDLPAGAVHLASSERTAHQAFRFGDSAYGLLFHLEVTPPQLDAMATAFADEIAAAGVSAAGLSDAHHLAATRDIGAQVFERFAELIVAAKTPRHQGDE
jgi:GMP synthase (glutamine-hydrolysing)